MISSAAAPPLASMPGAAAMRPPTERNETMTIQKYVEVDAEDVAQAMAGDHEFAMDVLANLAGMESESDIAAWQSACPWHDSVPGFLEDLAKAIRAND